MTQVNTEWACGRFNVKLTATADAAMVQTLAEYGLRWLGQRQTAIDKTLGAFKGDKRIAGWKRTDAAYSNELASKVQSIFNNLALPDGAQGELATDCTITEYVPGEGSEYKFTLEKAAIAKYESKPETEFKAWLDKLGFVGETHGEDGEYAEGLLVAVRERVRKLNEELKNSI